MSLFPLVQDPCPYKGPIEDILAGNQCRLCKREVHDLTMMTQAERIVLVAGCRDVEGLCVRYRVRAGSAVAAAMLGAAGLSAPAFAQTAEPPAQVQPSTSSAQPVAQDTVPPVAGASGSSSAETGAEDDYLEWGSDMIIVGGLRKPADAQWQSGEKSAQQPKRRSLPVIIEAAAPVTKS